MSEASPNRTTCACIKSCINSPTTEKKKTYKTPFSTDFFYFVIEKVGRFSHLLANFSSKIGVCLPKVYFSVKKKKNHSARKVDGSHSDSYY